MVNFAHNIYSQAFIIASAAQLDSMNKSIFRWPVLQCHIRAPRKESLGIVLMTFSWRNLRKLFLPNTKHLQLCPVGRTVD